MRKYDLTYLSTNFSNIVSGFVVQKPIIAAVTGDVRAPDASDEHARAHGVSNKHACGSAEHACVGSGGTRGQSAEPVSSSAGSLLFDIAVLLADYNIWRLFVLIYRLRSIRCVSFCHSQRICIEKLSSVYRGM
jgi:hypothetical protein